MISRSDTHGMTKLRPEPGWWLWRSLGLFRGLSRLVFREGRRSCFREGRRRGSCSSCSRWLGVLLSLSGALPRILSRLFPVQQFLLLVLGLGTLRRFRGRLGRFV